MKGLKLKHGNKFISVFKMSYRSRDGSLPLSLSSVRYHIGSPMGFLLVYQNRFIFMFSFLSSLSGISVVLMIFIPWFYHIMRFSTSIDSRSNSIPFSGLFVFISTSERLIIIVINLFFEIHCFSSFRLVALAPILWPLILIEAFLTLFLDFLVVFKSSCNCCDNYSFLILME